MSAGGCGPGCRPSRHRRPTIRARRHRRSCSPPRGRPGGRPARRSPPGWRPATLAEVDELQRQVEILALDQGDHGLKIILFLGGDAQFLALDLGPHALRPLITDDLADLLGVVLRDALLERDPEPVLLARGLRVARIHALPRDLAPDQLVLEHVEHGLGPLLAVGPDLHAMVPGPADGGADAAEVEAGRDLLGRLVEGVVDFLAVDLADDVEAAVGHARLPSRWWCMLGED